MRSGSFLEQHVLRRDVAAAVIGRFDGQPLARFADLRKTRIRGFDDRKPRAGLLDVDLLQPRARADADREPERADASRDDDLKALRLGGGRRSAGRRGRGWRWRSRRRGRGPGIERCARTRQLQIPGDRWGRGRRSTDPALANFASAPSFSSITLSRMSGISA